MYSSKSNKYQRNLTLKYSTDPLDMYLSTVLKEFTLLLSTTDVYFVFVQNVIVTKAKGMFLWSKRMLIVNDGLGSWFKPWLRTLTICFINDTFWLLITSYIAHNSVLTSSNLYAHTLI